MAVARPRPDDLYVHYGCGWVAPEAWLNFDASPFLWIERLPLLGRLSPGNPRFGRYPPNVRFADVTRRLPVGDGSCAGVYASHVLEHLSREGFERALAETSRILRPGGRFRAVVPDLESAARRYLADLESGTVDANDRFMRQTMLGVEHRGGLLAALRQWLGLSRHLWMWDHASLEARLRAHGFRHVRRAAFGDSEDPMFRLVEEESRFRDAAAVEAVR